MIFFSAWQVVSKQVGTWHAARHQTPIVVLAGGKIISMYQMQLQDLPLENCCGQKEESQDHQAGRRGAHSMVLREGIKLWIAQAKRDPFSTLKRPLLGKL